MKKLVTMLFVLCLMFSFQRNSLAQVTYDLQFAEVTNDGTNGGNFDVKVQIKANNGTFGLYIGNLVFTYNTAGLSFDTLWTTHNFSGGNYVLMNVTEPVLGRVSVNIELNSSPGTTVLQSFMDVVTLEFTIKDNTQTSMLTWRTQIPNPIIIISEDLKIIQYMNLINMDKPLLTAYTNLILQDKEFPSTFNLYYNYPNPFNPITNIQFDIPAVVNDPVETKLDIYNLVGQVIKNLYHSTLSTGSYKVQWDGTTDFGTRAPSGTYFVVLRADEYTQTEKIVLIK